MKKQILYFLILLFLDFCLSFSKWEKLQSPLNNYPQIVSSKQSIFAKNHFENILYKSTNNGNAWIKLDTLIDDYLFYGGYLVFNKSKLYVFEKIGNNSFVSDDEGNTFKKIDTKSFGVSRAIFKDSLIICIDNSETKIFRSSNNGESWEQKLDLNGIIMRSLTSNNKYFFATEYESAHDSIHRSDDNGVTWKSVSKLLLASAITFGTDNETLILNSTFGMFRSTDYGINWVKTEQDLIDINIRNFANYKNITFALGENFYLSYDNGLNWEINEDGFDKSRLSLNWICFDDKYVYVTSDYDIWRRPLNEIEQKLTANFDLVFSIGETPFTVKFNNKSIGDIKSYKWYFGDGDSSLIKNPNHIYKEVGYFDVTLIVFDGQIYDTLVKKSCIKTQLPFKAMFELSENSGIIPLEVRFLDKSLGEIKFYKWYFGDGDSSTFKNPIHTYIKTGIFDVTLVVSDSLFQNKLTLKNHIQVFQNLQAIFENSNNIGLAPLNVNFINKSTGEIKSNKWYFGDGASSILSNPSHTYTKAGNFTVSLIVSDGTTSSTYTKEKFISVSDNTDVEGGLFNKETPPFSPNPVKDKLFIKTTEFNIDDKIQILDLKGRKLIETELNEIIDVSSLSKGIYFLKIRDKEWKFIKE
ncbi:MAG: PKD domain-containing protein [Candidatus Kapabacteria bacterium]|nr:PKD domain-containing protein [Candidatus Kapabacteria bacterium]